MAKRQYRTAAYRQSLKVWEAWMETRAWTCRRCGKAIPSGDRSVWDLGHDTPAMLGGDGGYEPEHARCNRSAGAIMGNSRKSRPSRDWW